MPRLSKQPSTLTNFGPQQLQHQPFRTNQHILYKMPHSQWGLQRKSTTTLIVYNMTSLHLLKPNHRQFIENFRTGIYIYIYILVMYIYIYTYILCLSTQTKLPWRLPTQQQNTHTESPRYMEDRARSCHRDLASQRITNLMPGTSKCHQKEMGKRICVPHQSLGSSR